MLSKLFISHSKKFALLFLIFFATCAFAYFSEFNASAKNNSSPIASLNLVINVAQDGIQTLNTTADTLNGRTICATNPTAGCDFSQTDGIVRTNDSVVYLYDYSVNDTSDDITITATAPLGTTWNVLPGFCNSGSTLNSGNGITTNSIITCKRGVQAIGTTESLPFTLTVLGSANHNTTLTATGAVSGLASATVNANAPNVTVTAAPRFNLRLAYQTHAPFTFNAVSGYRIEYRAYVEMFDDSTPAALNPRFGSASLETPFTFTDVVSGISPNSLLQSCAKQSDNSGNGGTISCTQPSAGQNISVSVANSNTTLSQWATPPSDNRFLTGTYQIFVFIPQTDVTSAPGQSLSTTNVLQDFDPNSSAGQSNFAAQTESTTDNTVTRAITALSGSFGVAFVKDYNNSNTSTVGVAVGSNRFVATGETFAVQTSLNNNTGIALNNVMMCNVMDNSKYSVTETAVGSGIVSGNDSTAPTSIEYATGYVSPSWLPTASGGNPNGFRNECNDAGITWYSSPTAVPGGVSAITKYRVRYTTLAVGAVGTVRVRVRARDTNFYNNTTIFNGAVLPDFGIWRSDEFNPTYSSNTYYQNVYPNNSSGSPGARLFLARAIARITKETESSNSVNSVVPGGSIGFVLKPTLSTVGTPNAVQVSVMDVLPFGLTYLAGTGQQNSQSFEPQIIACTGNAAPDSHCTANGQQLLVWTLNNQIPNAAIAPISFRALADLSILNNQNITNTAIVSSPADPTTENLRTATRTVVGASPSTLLIFKNTNTPQIEVGDNFRYTVYYRNASFVNDFSNLDFIDVLPFNGDATLSFDAATHQRSPATNFNGTRTLSSVSATTGGAIWYFTNAASASINISPKFTANLLPGTAGSIWCAGTSAGPNVGCGFSMADVTAVRLVDTTLLPRNNSVRSFTLNLSSSGNQSGNRYTNNSSGSADELALAISSNNVPVIVLESSISGSIWYDTNGDGVRGAEETGRVSGSDVTLTGTDNDGNNVNRTTQTAVNGVYSFSGLTSGNYTIGFSRPTNYSASPADIGADDTIDADGNSTTLITAPIPLGINEARTNVDEGFFQLNLSGTVWNDTNNDGLFSSEIGIGSVAVQLLDANSVLISSTQTDSGGNYSFTNLPAGDYRVQANLGVYSPSSVFSNTPNNNVDNDNNGESSSGWSISRVITLSTGNEPTINQSNGTTLNSTLDFGLRLFPTAATLTVGGRIISADGRGISRAFVTLVEPDGTVHYAMTNPFGFYRFMNIPAGETVVVSVNSKSHIFLQAVQIVTVTEDLTELNFVSL